MTFRDLLLTVGGFAIGWVIYDIVHFRRDRRRDR
jgi:hypothetical protein